MVPKIITLNAFFRVTVELKADNRLQGFGSDLLPRKRRNVYVSV